MGVMQQPPLGPGQLIVTPHPLMLDGQRSVVWEARAGESLYAILQRNVPELDGQRWEVCIGGRSVERHLWHHVRPKQGQVIEVRGGVGRSALALVAVLALTYFTFGAGGMAGGAFMGLTGVAGYAAAAAVYMAGAMLVNKVLAPKQPKVDNRQQDPVHSISGARNQLRLYEPYPLLFGRVQITPDLLSKPYTWYEGNDQFLGLLLSAGINVGRIEALYNGDTPLSNYEGVQVYHAGYSQMQEQTIPLYSNADTIDGAELTKDKAWVERTTSADTVRIQINLEYVLGGTGTSGKSYYVSETVEAQYRPVGTTNWQPLASQTFRSDRFDVRRATLARDVARGQYDVRVRMLGQGNYEGKNTQKNDFQWTQLTSVQADDADYTGIARSGVRIKATGQLNGSPDELRGVAFAAPIPEWSGTAWVTKESSNPGAQCVAYARGFWAGPRLLAGMALADAQIDLESWKAFSLHCAANGYTYDFYVKDARSHTDVLASIARAGFGEITWAGGRLGVVWAAQEQPLSGVVAMPTIKKGTFQVDYTLASAADGIEYTYIDATDWQAKTLRVPAPGVDIMLNPAQVSGEGVSTEQHAARAARWHLAQHLYQYKDIGYSTDIEHLTYQRLSLLALQHDLTQWGYGGRVQGASGTGGAMTLLLDEPVPAPTAGNAYIGLRIPGERVYRVLRVQPFSGTSSSITLADPWPADAAIPGADPENPAHDTIWVYDFRQTPGYRVRVTSIEPEPDLKGAAVRVVPEGPEFWDYVLTGHYIPAPNQSLLQTRPVASNLRISEAQIVQGNTTFTELTATFDVTGPVGTTVVRAAGAGGELQDVAQTVTRTATWRINDPGTYTIVVRPFSPDGEAGVAVQAVYTTGGAGIPPVLVDLFDVVERSGGVRVYTWGWLADTMRSPDFAGVEIRYTSGNAPVPDWNTMTPLGESGYYTAPFESVLPAAGEWTIACRSRNTAGQLSEGMRTVTRTFGPNLGEIIDDLDPEGTTEKLIELQRQIDEANRLRFEGDAKEASDRADQIAAETQQRQQQIDAERAARQAAVAAAQERINTILSDSIISADEKPQLIRDYQALLNELPGIEAEAKLSEATEQFDAYKGAVDDLTDYLATLNDPVPWNDTSGFTYIK
ncbi:host specificity factor TipJ family phage tail protein [Stenotrophomonas acidaminiphila]|uniref:host specificity factor TipJ family phage tail protein n=1 Tax=Stenotrophomonas acidaminiphila TaxID=128780 RepID=UPI0028B0965C|nr:host specificity factor TipJ family phage tail protein [Stenotrophomonas acidaminiphila]